MNVGKAKRILGTGKAKMEPVVKGEMLLSKACLVHAVHSEGSCFVLYLSIKIKIGKYWYFPSRKIYPRKITNTQSW